MAKLGKLVENAQKKQQNRANELASYIGTPENQAAAAEIQKKWDTELTKPPVTTPAQSRVNAVEDIWDRGSTTGGSKATATSNLANQIIALENQRKAMEAERSSLYSALSDPTTFDPSKLSQLGNYDTEIQSVKDQMKELSKIRPEYKTEEAEARYKTYANAEERIKSKYGSVEALVKDLETRAADLDRQTEKLKQLEAQYKENPSEKLYTEYTKAYEGYTKAAKTYQGLYLDYQPLQQAWQDYEAYDIAAQGKAGAGETAKRIAQAGITQVGSALWQTAALGEKALGAVFPGVSTPITDEANRVKADADRYALSVKEATHGHGKMAELGGDVGVAAVAAVPQAVLAFLTRGQSLAESSLVSGIGPNAGLAGSLMSTIKSAMKNPSYLASMAQTLGPDFQEAKNAGASDLEAAATALIASSINAGVEIGGGLEKLGDADGTLVERILKRGHEEGWEEVLQGIISGTVNKGIYDFDKPIASLTDQNAILNPQRMATEYGTGAAVGMLLYGTMSGTMSGLAAAANKLTGPRATHTRTDHNPVSPAAAPEVQQLTQQAEVVQAANPEATVLDAATTMYFDIAENKGKNTMKKAKLKAEVVNRLIEGKKVEDGEINALNLTDQNYREVFTKLTGVQFPDGKLQIEQLRSLARSAHTVAQQAKQVQAAPAAPVAPITQTGVAERVAQAQQRAAQAVPETDNAVTFEAFVEHAKQYPEYANAGAEVLEVAYAQFLQDSGMSVEMNGKPMSFAEFVGVLRSAPDGDKLTVGEAGIMFQQMAQRQNMTKEANYGGQNLLHSEGLSGQPDQRSGGQSRSVPETAGRAEGDGGTRRGDQSGSQAGRSGEVRSAGQNQEGTGSYRTVKVNGNPMTEVRPEAYTPEMQGLVDQYAAIGVNAHIVIEGYPIDAEGHYADGITIFNTDGTIDVFLQVVGAHAMLERSGHEKAHVVLGRSPAVKEQAIAALGNAMSEKELLDLVNAYLPMYGSAYANSEDLIGDLLEEIICDAYANLNRANAGAPKYHDAVSGVIEAQLQSYSASYGQDVTLTDDAGNLVVESDGNGHSTFSMSTYDESGRDILTQWMGRAVVEGDLTSQDADDIIKTMDLIYDICKEARESGEYAPFDAWSEAKVVVNEKGEPVFSVVKANGDYAMNLDFSLVCKKRRTLDAVLNELVRRGFVDNLALNEKQIVKINELIRSYGFETACDLCFVDAKRYRQGKVADDFVKLYNDLVLSMVPKNSGLQPQYFNFGSSALVTNDGAGIHELPDTELDFTKIDKVLATKGEKTVEYKTAMLLKNSPADRKLTMRGDFLSTRGFDAINRENPRVLKLFNSKKGSGGPKSAVSDVQYLNEVLTSKTFTPEKAYAVGGVRIQSFSDYVPRMVFDYVQMIADLAAKKLPAHAYTKEELFVKQFGLTGMKINMSLIPKVVDGGIAPGLDADGNYAWADESFDFEEAKRIQNADGYSRNCGTIAVGVSDEHIRTLMADPEIRMVIPYHKSGLSPIVAKMNKIDQFVNYTDFQNTRRPNGKHGKKLSKDVAADKKLLDEMPDFNTRMRELGDPRAAAEEYVRWCEEHDLLPKFDQFAYKQIDGVIVEKDGQRVVDENYYKLLEDFTVYDNGEYTPQTGLTMTFPSEDSAFGSMKDLIKRGLEEDAVLEGKRDEKVPEIVGEIMKFSIVGEEKTTDTLNLPNEVIFGARYSDLKNNGDIRDYDLAKKGDIEAAARLIQKYVTDTDVAKIAAFGENVYLLPVQGKRGNTQNVIPQMLGVYISKATGQSVLRGVYQTEKLNRRSQSSDARLAATDVEFDIADDSVYDILNGAEVVAIDDNTSFGSTLRGIAKFLQAHNAKMVGSYVLTVGGDNSEALVVTDETWNAIEKEGIENVERYAREHGYTDAFTREQLGERRAQDFLREYQNDAGRSQRNAGGVRGNRQEVLGVHHGAQYAPEALSSGEGEVTEQPIQASEKSGASSLLKYSITPQFEQWYKETYGTELTSAQLKRRLQTAERRAAEAEHDKKAAELKNTIDSEMDLTAWMIHHTKKMREQKRASDAKLAEARKAKTEAVRTAVAETKEIERAKAEVQHDADRMAERRNAAKRLRTQENAYTNKVTELKENAKLKRNAAKATLRDSRLAAKKRAEIEAEQGLVDTIRKNPKQRTGVEKLQDAAQQLRTLGRSAYRNFVNMAESIDRFSKRQVSDMRAGTLVNILGGSASTMETVFKKGLVDRAGNRIGESMSDVFLCWDEAHKKVNEGMQALLQDFMLHWHNIDRMSIVARAESALETFELNHEWLRDMDQKEFARLVAMTEKEVEKLGKHEAQQQAFEYVRLIRAYNEAQNKPIFADDKGNSVTAETSQRIVDQYLEEHPWLLDKANGIYEWWDLFMRNWAVGDTISETEYNRMRQMYPHYVPTYRVDKNGVGGAGFVGAGGATVSKAVKKAKGSHSEVMNIEDSFSNIVSKIIRLNRLNELYMNIVDTAMLDEDGTFADMAYFDWDWQDGAYANALITGSADIADLTDTVAETEKAGLEKVGSDYKLTGWKDGRKYTAYISEELYKSIGMVTGHLANDLEENLLKAGNTLTTPMKTAITGVNPTFAVRNLSRDLPTAIVNSISGLNFPKYYAQAAKEIAKNSDHWKTFQALGGTHATYYNDNQGFTKAMSRGQNPAAWAVGKLGAFNEITEAQTRFAEYLATVDKLGDTYEARLQGIKNAAEVTVDFSRKGRYGKVINAWVPYWNPAVQGIDKTVRSVIDSPDGSAVWKQASKTLGRAAMTTVLFEAILFGVLKALDRDDEWEELNDRTKDTYYCIPLKDSNRFLKIPKNREWGAILGTPFMRMLEWANGREDPFENYIETAIEPNFMPPAIFRPDSGGGFASDIIGISQALDLAKNEDFAGRTIVPYAYQQGTLSQQFDNETSALAKKLGELFNWSPMQIDYIIGDYFGDFGDMFINATSEATWNGEQNLGKAALEIVTNPFLADARYSNASVSKYYDLMDDLGRVVQDKKNQMGNDAAKETLEYQTEKAIDEMYGKQISELNRIVRELPDGTEKDNAKAQIAQLTKEAIEFYHDSMAGKVSNPIRTAEYSDFSEPVSKELIRMDSYSGDYKFVPYDVPKSKYNDPDDEKNREYILTDEQKDYFKQLYREKYNEIFEDLIQSSKYKKKKDSEKAELLEDARDDVLDATKEEFFEWLDDTGVRSTKKQK